MKKMVDVQGLLVGLGILVGVLVLLIIFTALVDFIKHKRSTYWEMAKIMYSEKKAQQEVKK